jgi:hypothetical protein
MAVGYLEISALGTPESPERLRRGSLDLIDVRFSLPQHSLAQQDGFGQAGGHDLVAVDERQ